MSTPRPPEAEGPPPEQEAPGRRSRRASLATALVLEDFRSVRRWLIVLGVLAVLATGLAAYALVKAYESEEESADRARVVRLERELDARLAELQAALDRTGEESDIARLQREVRRKANAAQLARTERRVQREAAVGASALDTAQDVSRELRELAERVEALEEQPRRQR